MDRNIANHLARGSNVVTRHLIWLQLAAFLFSLQMGCACKEIFVRKEMPLDVRWGQSFETVRDSQIIHPVESEERDRAVEAIDGQTAGSIMNKYHKSFEKAAPRPVYSVSFGSSGM